jgi:hypothetical protein
MENVPVLELADEMTFLHVIGVGCPPEKKLK